MGNANTVPFVFFVGNSRVNRTKESRSREIRFTRAEKKKKKMDTRDVARRRSRIVAAIILSSFHDRWRSAARARARTCGDIT